MLSVVPAMFAFVVLSTALFAQPPRSATVPDVIGRTAQDARKILGEAGLEVRFQLGERAPAENQAMTVYAQSPVAGARVPADGRVTLTIYDKAAVASGVGTVPPLAGLSAERAKRALLDSELVPRFRLGQVSREPAEALHVYDQNPEAGTQLPAGAVVEVTVYEPAEDVSRQGGQELARVSSTPFLDRNAETVEPASGLLLVEATDLSVPIGGTSLEICRFLQIRQKLSLIHI